MTEKTNVTEPDDRDEIAALIRAAGKRPAVAEERALRVRAAVQAHWQRELTGRRRRRVVWSGLALAAASLIVLVSLTALKPDPVPPPETRIAGTVESIVGACWVGDRPAAGAAGSASIRHRQNLSVGSFITTGEEGRLSLRLASGYEVKLDRDTRVRLEGPGVLALDTGAVYVDSGRSGGNAGTLRIRTALGTIQEIGTSYEVRLHQGSIRVRVREGLVILDDGSRTHQVRAWAELTIDGTSGATIREIPTDGADWDWIAELSAVPELKGLSAREFLDWAARQRNWRLVFSTDELKRSASEIILGGSAGGLTLEESLDAVLPTCGMSYRVENGALVISPLSNDPGAP